MILFYMRLPWAEKGYVPAQVKLGVGLISGDWTESRLAEHWFQKATTHDNNIAQFALGYIYEDGLGVSADKSEAEKMVFGRPTPRKKAIPHLEQKYINPASKLIKKRINHEHRTYCHYRS
jgi:hypothetical protein